MAGNVVSLSLSVSAIFLTCVNGQPAQGLIYAPVSKFVRTGSTADVIRDLVRSTRGEGVFAGVVGLENLGDTGHIVSVAGIKTDIGTVLRTICGQDGSYEIVQSEEPELINLLARDSKVPGHEVLAFRIPTLDIEADVWPENLIRNLSDYSRPLAVYLFSVYLRLGGSTEPSGAGAGFSGNARIPHFSIHLKNVSVREALNAISLESFRMYQAIGVDPRLVSTPDQLRVTPMGWEYQLLDPSGIPFGTWSHEIFSPL